MKVQKKIQIIGIMVLFTSVLLSACSSRQEAPANSGGQMIGVFASVSAIIDQ